MYLWSGKMYHKRTREDITQMARIFDEYHTCFRNFVSDNPGHIKTSLDRGTIAYPKEMHSDETLDMLGSKRNSCSYSYGPEEGDVMIREQIAELENTKYGTEYSSEDIAIMPGAWGGLEFALQEILNFRKGQSKGKVVVIGPTLYQMFYTPIEHFGIDIEAYDFTMQGTSHVPKTMDDLKEVFESNPKAIVITNPNNPDGAYFDPTVLKEIIWKAEEKKAYILIDEIQNCFPSKDRGLKYGTWINSPNVIRVDSPSKRYALSDCRVGWMIAKPKILYGNAHTNRLEGVVGRMSGIMGNAPRIANNFLAHLLKREKEHSLGGENPFKEYQEKLDTRKDLVLKELANMPRVKEIYTSEACVNITAKFDVSETDIELSKNLMKRGVLIMPASGYGYNPEDSVLRITFAEREQKIKEGLDILKKYLLEKK